MSHPNSVTEKVGDVHVKAKAFRTNLYFYKSIGGAVEVRGEKRERSWKCLWLCKKRVKVKADRITITNQFADGDTSPSGLDDLLPLQGVLSTASVTIGGRTHAFVTGSGPHPG